MDVIEYYKIKNRFCDCYDECVKCPLHESCDSKEISKIEESVEILENWAKEHPIKTNLIVVAEGLEKLGYKVDRDNLKYKCPPRFSSNFYTPNPDRCSFKCEECKEWWDEEWKEQNHGLQ